VSRLATHVRQPWEANRAGGGDAAAGTGFHDAAPVLLARAQATMATPHTRAWYRALLRAAVRSFPAVRVRARSRLCAVTSASADATRARFSAVPAVLARTHTHTQDGSKYAVGQVRRAFREPVHTQITASVLESMCRPKLELLEMSNPPRPQPPVVDIPYDPLLTGATPAPPLRPHLHHHAPAPHPTPTAGAREPPPLLTLIGADARLVPPPTSRPAAAASAAAPTAVPSPAPAPATPAAAPAATPAPQPRPAVRMSTSPLPKATSRRPLEAAAAGASPTAAGPATAAAAAPKAAAPSASPPAAAERADEAAAGPRPYIEVAKTRPFSLFNQEANQPPTRPASATWAAATSDIRFNYWLANYEHLRSTASGAGPTGARK